MRRSIGLLLLFILSFVLRFSFFNFFLQDNPCKLMYDAGHYHELAQSIVAGVGFIHRSGKPQFYRVPGYSLFLAVGYRLFDGDIDKTLLLQLFVSSLIPLLIFWLTLIIFPGGFVASWCAGIVSAIHPGLLIFSGLVMSETLFVFFLLIFFLLFFIILKNVARPQRIIVLFAGIFLGVLSLIRPIGIPVLVVCAVVMMITYWFRCKFSDGFYSFILLVFGWLISVSWWLIRNWLLTGYLFFHTLPGVHFLNHTASRLIMSEECISYKKAKQKVVKQLDARVTAEQERIGRRLHEIEYCHIAEQISAEVVRHYPIQAVWHSIGNMLKTTFALYSSELLVIDGNGKLPPYSLSRGLIARVKRFLFFPLVNKWIQWFIYYEIFLNILLLIGFIVFLLQQFFCRNYVILVQVLSFVGLFIFLSLACGFARLRLPIEPFFIIVSSVFWVNFFQEKRLKSEE